MKNKGRGKTVANIFTGSCLLIATFGNIGNSVCVRWLAQKSGSGCNELVE